MHVRFDIITARSRQLTTLLACCCRRKRFITSLLKQAGDDCILLAVRGCDAAQEALCLMLEWRLLPNEEARLQIVNALESTESGKKHYAALCQRQKNLQELVSEFANRSTRRIGRLLRPAFFFTNVGDKFCRILMLFHARTTYVYIFASNKRVDPGN